MLDNDVNGSARSKANLIFKCPLVPNQVSK